MLVTFLKTKDRIMKSITAVINLDINSKYNFESDGYPMSIMII